jgi:hypothetical protein
MSGYASVSTIGSYCEAAHQLRRAARDVVSGPLDWVFADRLAILACIENDFAGLCEWENLVITADLLRIQDRVFGVDFFHQFPRDAEGRLEVYKLREARRAYLPRLAHLVENYRAIGGRHLFVWAVDARKLRAFSAHAAAHQMLAALRRRKPACELLVVQSDAPADPDWGYGTINRYTAATPGVWQGDDAGWNAIFAELGIVRADGAAPAHKRAAVSA